jgi:hypothetical protein
MHETSQVLLGTTDYPVWSKTMPSTTRSSRPRPPGAPVYYLGRHADWWITALRQQPHGRLPQVSAADPR